MPTGSVCQGVSRSNGATDLPYWWRCPFKWPLFTLEEDNIFKESQRRGPGDCKGMELESNAEGLFQRTLFDHPFSRIFQAPCCPLDHHSSNYLPPHYLSEADYFWLGVHTSGQTCREVNMTTQFHGDCTVLKTEPPSPNQDQPPLGEHTHTKPSGGSCHDN